MFMLEVGGARLGVASHCSGREKMLLMPDRSDSEPDRVMDDPLRFGVPFTTGGARDMLLVAAPFSGRPYGR